VARLALLLVLGLLLSLACGQSAEPTPRPTRLRVVRPTPLPTPTATPVPTARPRPTPTPRLVSAGTGVAPTPVRRADLLESATTEPLPTATPAAQTVEEARNLVWVYLTQCATFDPAQLDGYLIKDEWYVKATSKSSLQFGVWRVDATTGDLEPHDVMARQWQPYIESSCSPEAAKKLFSASPTPTPTVGPSPIPTRTPRPTNTPTPIPTATPVVPQTNDAVASLWAYLVKCFPTAELKDFEAVLDPVTKQYVVKDKDEIQYGVWRVNKTDGIITPDNVWARGRDQTVRSGTC